MTATYNELLERYVSSTGEVDYQSWHQSASDIAAFDIHLSTLSAATPKERPELFPNRDDQLAYWLDLYNSLVLREILRRWPLNSVRDYQPTLLSKIDTTKGFFRDLRFTIGDKKMSLDDIENATIRKDFDDARIHFALNCGSSSCPIIQPTSFSGSEFEDKMQRATVDFIGDDENVRVDELAKKVYVSKIFKWYKSDFVAHAIRVTGRSRAGLIEFLLIFSNETLSASLKQARSEGFALAYNDYDWSVNQT